MSSQALGWVLDHSPTEGTERLVLLSLANHATTSPVGGAWEADPPVEVIQREANLRRERTVQEVLVRLIEGGHVERILNGSPDERVRGDRRPNLYRIVLSRGVRLKAEASNPPRGAARRHGVNGLRGAASRTSRGAASRRNSDAHGVPPGADSRGPDGVPPDANGVSPGAAPPASRSSSFPRNTTTFSQSSVTASTGASATDDGRTDPRIGPVAAVLGLRDHDAAVAANNPPVKRLAPHLEACVERWLTGTLRVVIDGLCAEHPGWTVDELVAAIGSPSEPAASSPLASVCDRCAGHPGLIELPDEPGTFDTCDHGQAREAS